MLHQQRNQLEQLSLSLSLHVFFSHSSISYFRQRQCNVAFLAIDSQKLRTRDSGPILAISLGNAFHHSIYSPPHHLLFHLTSPFPLSLMQWIATKQLVLQKN